MSAHDLPRKWLQAAAELAPLFRDDNVTQSTEDAYNEGLATGYRECANALREALADEWPNYGREDIVVHDTDGTPAVVIRPGQPIHVFGAVDVFTGRYAAEGKLAELENGEPDFNTPHMQAYLRDVVTD